MPLPASARRGLTALVSITAIASAAHAEIPRQHPARCQGQPVLTPFEPLTILTAQGPRRFRVELADTPIEREFGLMCRAQLAPDAGMLFDFGGPSNDVAFWMRNTLIGLDIIYIRPDGTVLSIARQAKPLDETLLPAGGVVRAVLEIPAGRAAQLGIQPGDKVISRILAR